MLTPARKTRISLLVVAGLALMVNAGCGGEPGDDEDISGDRSESKKFHEQLLASSKNGQTDFTLLHPSFVTRIELTLGEMLVSVSLTNASSPGQSYGPFKVQDGPGDSQFAVVPTTTPCLPAGKYSAVFKDSGGKTHGLITAVYGYQN